MKTKISITRVVVGIVLAFLIVSTPASAQSFREFPLGVDWRQIETEHFLIVYDDAYRDSAEKVAEMADPIHKQVTEFLQYVPTSKTTIVLTDHVDFINGYATPIPNNRVVLLLREPGAGDSLFGLWSPDWLAMVLTHEYTHIVQLDMVDGLNALGRKIFGRIVLPNAGLSAWMIEGLAVYAETKFHNGRGRHPSYDMFMRTDVLENQFKALDQMAAIGIRTWPRGSVYYLYGYFFMQYLADTYGEERMVELSLYNSEKLPGMKNIYKKVYDNKKLSALWEEWRDAMQERYHAQIEAIKTTPLTEMTPLSASGYYTNSPVFSPDGEYVYYDDAGAHDTPALVQYRVSDGTLTRLTDGRISGNFSVSADGRTIYLCRIDAYRIYSDYSDVYALNVDSRKVRQLTHGLRAFDPAVSPDGNTLVFTTTRAGSMSLMQMNLTTDEITPLWETTNHTQIAHPAFSSDGSKLAVMAWVEGGFQDIYVMDSDGGNRRALTYDQATDSSPVWGMDDTYIFFSSDRTGVPNIFAYDTTEDMLYQVTNVLTGAFNPAVSPDGSMLVCELYSSSGMNIHRADLDPETWRATALAPEVLPEFPPYQVADIQKPLEARPYRAFPSMLPTFWVPDWGEDEDGYQLGFSTYGYDVLGRHEYTLATLYGLESQRFSLFGSYTNRQFFPDITLFGSDTAHAFGNIFDDADGEDKTYWQREQTAGLNIGVPLYVSQNTVVTMSAGYRFKRMQSLINDELTPAPDEGDLSGVSVGLSFQNLDRSIYGIAPESGITASITYQHDDTELGSDFTLDTVVADTRGYLEMPWLRHHVLALRLTGGISEGDTLSQGLFQIGGFDLDTELSSLERQRYFLRGYKSGQFSGNRLALGSTEYRMPLWYPQRGILDGWLFFDSVVATAFYDVGYAWDGDVEFDDFKHGVGGELRLNIGLFEGALPVMLRAGYAKGLDEDDGKSQFIYGVNFDFWL